MTAQALRATAALILSAFGHGLEVGYWKAEANVCSIVVNTFKRDTCLQQVVAHYMSCKTVVDTIHVVWNEPDREPPEWLVSAAVDTAPNDVNVGSRIPRVVIDRNEGTNLTNRFKPRSFTSEAVFSQDDDELFSCEVLEAGLRVWQRFPERVVGFAPRVVPVGAADWRKIRDKPYDKAWKIHTANMVLPTKGSFIHRRYFPAFFDPSLQSLRDQVDGNKTAEDFMMFLVVLKSTGLPPVPLLVHYGGSVYPKTEKGRKRGQFQSLQNCGTLGLTDPSSPANKYNLRAQTFVTLLKAFKVKALPNTTDFIYPLNETEPYIHSTYKHLRSADSHQLLP